MKAKKTKSGKKSLKITSAVWAKMAKAAWAVRENARILEDTHVGAAMLTANGKIFAGCNVEHSMRSHDFHAETNAIGNMIAAGEKEIKAVLVVARCSRLTPCGGCMDWILEFGDPSITIATQNVPGGKMTKYRAGYLMPVPPRK